MQPPRQTNRLAWYPALLRAREEKRFIAVQKRDEHTHTNVYTHPFITI